MFPILFLIFILVPVVELSVLIRIGDILGAWTTVALCLFSALVGASLVRSQGLSTLMQAREKLARGESPGQEVIEGMMLAAAGVLLVIPGFVTDFIGLLLLTPLTRGPIARYLLKRAQIKVSKQGGFSAGFGGQGFGGFGQQSRQNPFDSARDNHSGNTFDGDFERKQGDDRGLSQGRNPKDPDSQQ